MSRALFRPRACLSLNIPLSVPAGPGGRLLRVHVSGLHKIHQHPAASGSNDRRRQRLQIRATATCTVRKVVGECAAATSACLKTAGDVAAVLFCFWSGWEWRGVTSSGGFVLKNYGVRGAFHGAKSLGTRNVGLGN